MLMELRTKKLMVLAARVIEKTCTVHRLHTVHRIASKTSLLENFENQKSIRLFKQPLNLENQCIIHSQNHSFKKID